MYVSFRNIAALLSLTAAASLSWYFSRPPAEPPRVTDGDAPPLGYYLRDATLLGTDESGRLLYRIHAAEAVADRRGDGLAMTDVRVEYVDEQAVDWSISAERAVTPGDRSTVELEQVRLAREGAAGREETVVAPHLRLDPDEYFASTDAPVEVRTGRAVVRGVGLDAWLREDRIDVKSEIHGSYKRDN